MVPGYGFEKRSAILSLQLSLNNYEGPENPKQHNFATVPEKKGVPQLSPFL